MILGREERPSSSESEAASIPGRIDWLGEKGGGGASRLFASAYIDLAINKRKERAYCRKRGGTTGFASQSSSVHSEGGKKDINCRTGGKGVIVVGSLNCEGEERGFGSAFCLGLGGKKATFQLR